MSATTRRRALAALALPATLLLAGCYVDEDGDGYDDNTGRPIPTYSSDTGGGSEPDPHIDPALLAEAAHHEAAHKAVADHYGWPVRYTRLDSDGEGRTQLAGWGMPCDCPVKVVAFALAGEYDSGIPASDVDLRLVERALRQVPKEDRAGVEDAGRDEAMRIVAARSGRISADAAVLLERGEL